MEAQVTTAPAGAMNIPDQIARPDASRNSTVTLLDMVQLSVRIHLDFQRKVDEAWRQSLHDVMSVQPMTGPVGQIFTLRRPLPPEKVINIDPDPEIGELFEVDDHWMRRVSQPQQRFLRVTCGTGRKFVLSVPPWVETALEAQAWTWGLNEGVFMRPEVRT